jgi:hypothetical protein
MIGIHSASLAEQHTGRMLFLLHEYKRRMHRLPIKYSEHGEMEGDLMAKAASIVIFPGGGWSSLGEVYDRLFQQFADQYKLYLVSEVPIAGIPPNLMTITLQQAKELDWSLTAAAVLHPCWVQAALAVKPFKVIALLDAPQPDEPPLWGKCRTWLAGHADLIVTATETYYLELAFRSGLIFLLDNRDDINELLVKQGVGWMLEGFDPAALVRLQQRCLAEGWSKRLQADGDGLGEHRLQGLFFHAVYRYLIDDLKAATEETLAAFELAVLEGNEGALALYYRFLSATELKRGWTRQAVQTYSFSAVTAQEKSHVERIDQMLGEGRDGLAAALLFQLNDDYRLALRQLEQLPACAEAVRMTVEIETERGNVSRAAALLEGLNRREYPLLFGTAAMLAGNRHEAIHAFLEAAEEREEALGNIVEMALLDEAAQLLAQAENGGGWRQHG